MPIAATLFYLQRRRPQPPPAEPTNSSPRRHSPATARRQVHPIRSAHHRTGYEITRGNQRDCGARKSITEPTRDKLLSSGLSTNTSNDRLPDAVQQAKERLHQRLRSLDLFAGRRQTSPAVRTIQAGPHLSSETGVCTAKDSSLDGQTIRFNSSATLSTHKVKQITAGPCSDAAGVAPGTRPVSKLGEETLPITIEGGDRESSVDCSICLEGCHGAAEGLVQLQCKHVFHSACLEQWLQSRADCRTAGPALAYHGKSDLEC
ncbi:probable E3 ubiquitin-protein ligase RHY1A [Lolium perenne]|uniref:probable E3 ubiquitin-protein ligase RHY1A n=1 Tax=Lolium perenne TaxID=4522 RepID=UPI003A99710D